MNNFFKKNEKYTTIAIYVFLTILALILVTLSLVYFSSIKKFFDSYRSVFSPIIVGIVFAVLFSPIVNFWERKVLRFKSTHKYLNVLKRFFSIFLTLIVALALITAIVVLVVPTVYNNYEDFEGKLTSYVEQARSFIDGFISSSSLSEYLTNYLDQFSSSFNTVVDFLINYLGRFVVSLKNGFIGIFIGIYFLASKEHLAAQIKKILYSIFNRRFYLNLVNCARYTNRSFSGFLVGKTLDSIIIGVISFILFFIFRIPYATLLSVIVTITNIIPVFGPIIGAVPCAFIVFLTNPSKLIWLIVIILVVQTLDGNVIGPKILGNSTGISALWVLLAIVVFGGFFGVAGMIIGVPITAVIYTFASESVRNRLIRKKRPASTAFYENDPPETDLKNHPVYYPKETVIDEIVSDSADEDQNELKNERADLKFMVKEDVQQLIKKRKLKKNSKNKNKKPNSDAAPSDTSEEKQ